MSKSVLLFGSAPLPRHSGICSAAGIRTQQFLSALEQRGHDVTCFLISNSEESTEWTEKNTGIISRHNRHLMSQARKSAREQNFDIAIGVNTFPAYIAAKAIPKSLPFWADINGWIMSEMQAQAYEMGHDHYLHRGWSQERSILLRADQMSTVSTPQKFATLGELSTLGRLNKRHFRHHFVHVVPNASQAQEEVSNASMPEKNTQREQSYRKKLKIPENAFVISQIGGFNNWIDEKTLFEAIEGVMKREPRIHFVTTGGKIAHVADHAFGRFVERVQRSEYQERFHLLGWVDAEEIPQIYEMTDIGILADIDCLETEIGARNRLNEMMAYGIPIVCTRGSEITFDIERWKCGKVVESGNSHELKEAVLSLCNDDTLRSEYGKNGRRVCQQILTNEKTVAPLLEWLESNDHDLLHLHRVNLDGKSIFGSIRAGIRFAKERGIKAFAQKILTYLKG